jgi:hypothetical protein
MKDTKMEEKIEQFKRYWCDHYIHILLNLTDDEITDFIQRCGGVIPRACDQAQDYLLASGQADVQE